MPPANHRKASNGYLLIKIEALGAEILLPNCKIRVLNYVNNLTNPTKTCQTLPKTFQSLLKPAKTFQTCKNIPKATKLPKTYHTHQKHAKTYTVVCHIVHITAKMQTYPNRHMKNINYRRRICRASMLVLFVNVGATTSSFGTSIHLYITSVKMTKCKNGGFC